MQGIPIRIRVVPKGALETPIYSRFVQNMALKTPIVSRFVPNAEIGMAIATIEMPLSASFAKKTQFPGNKKRP